MRPPTKETSSRPAVLAVLPGLIPSTLIGVVKPLLLLHQRGELELTVIPEQLATQRGVVRCDLLVFARNCEPRFCLALDLARRLRIPYVYDLDDDLFNVPASTKVGVYHESSERRALLIEYLRGAALVRTYAGTLAERLRLYAERIDVVRPSFDLSLIPSSPPSRRSQIRVVYATSRAEDELASMFLPAIRRLTKEAHGRVTFTHWGGAPDERLASREFGTIPFDKDYDRFVRRLYREAFDIGLAPLSNDEFHRSKTNTKFRDYGGCWVAGVYSDVEVYSSCVEDGITGLLVGDSEQEWYWAIRRLVEDDTQRLDIQRLARRAVVENYSVASAAQAWNREITAILDKGPSPKRGTGGPLRPAGSSMTSNPVDCAESLSKLAPDATVADLVGSALQGSWKIWFSGALVFIRAHMSELRSYAKLWLATR